MTDQVFDTLCEAISYAFLHEQTSLLSLDRICEVINMPNLFIRTKQSGIVPCSTISRRRISSTLSSSELFVRARAPRACLWAIRPHNPLLLTDGQISASVEHMLSTNGPLNISQFVSLTQLNGADSDLFERFFSDHLNDYTVAPDGTYWFAGQIRPTKMDFENMNSALRYAFQHFPQGASVEELHWFLCLSTVVQSKHITRRSVSRELSRRPDLFHHLARAKYTVNPNLPPIKIHPTISPINPLPSPSPTIPTPINLPPNLPTPQPLMTPNIQPNDLTMSNIIPPPDPQNDIPKNEEEPFDVFAFFDDPFTF